MGRIPTRRKLFNVMCGTGDDAAVRSELLNCTPGEVVSLRWDRHSGGEPNSIAVFSARGKCIGSIAAEHACILAPALDEGLPHAAILHELHGLFGESEYHARIEVAWHSV